MRSVCVGLIVLLVAAIALCDEVHYRAADGTWAAMEATADGGRLKITIGTENAPNGEAVLVIAKPDWMVLDDGAAPQLTGMKVNGTARPTSTEPLHLGVVSGDTVEVVVGVKDDGNPISANVGFSLADSMGATVDVDNSALGVPNKSGRVVATVNGLPAGRYEGMLTLSDMAPLVNQRSWPFELTVMGVTIADDMQNVSLANASSGFRLQPGIGEQLLLPNGLWSKLTTNTAGQYLYPREFVDAEIIRQTDTEQTVLVRAIPQDLKQKPVDDLAEIEYELTVRSDTPALLLTTRSRNVSETVQSIGTNYGWLGCPYYVTPEGRAEWSSDGANKYTTIGNVGWVWLAPKQADKPGLLWASTDRFGEFTGGSVLLYGEDAKVQPDEVAEMRMAFAAADTPEDAKAIYDDLVSKGLIDPPQE